METKQESDYQAERKLVLNQSNQYEVSKFD